MALSYFLLRYGRPGLRPPALVQPERESFQPASPTLVCAGLPINLAVPIPGRRGQIASPGAGEN